MWKLAQGNFVQQAQAGVKVKAALGCMGTTGKP